MAKVALYRHYRSRDFKELIGQDHVVNLLESAVSKHQISHAYLFTGPRGVGKTSAARILARRINKLDVADEHPDIIEIDAASNNGVDEIRDLREKVHVTPNFLDYKVYIIDEVHMLSNAAFNALLKTLEEPPEHAVFVLATTEPHKLPDTIVSRTQHFPFRPISKQSTKKHLQVIAEAEGIDIDESALELIAELGEGSMRDSIGLLDQIGGSGASGEITTESVHDLLGIASDKSLDALLEAVIKNDLEQTISSYDQLLEEGISPHILQKQLLIKCRHYVRTHIKDETKLTQLRRILHGLSSLPMNTPNSEFALEAILVELATDGTMHSATETSKTFHQRISQKNVRSPQAPAVKQRKEKSQKTKKSGSRPQKQADTTPPADKHTQVPAEAAWVKVLSVIKRKHTTLYGLLRNTDVELSEGKCTIRARFIFHYRRIAERQHQDIIRSTLHETTGLNYTITLIEPPQKPDDKNTDEDDTIQQVRQILGGEIVHG